MQSVDNKHPILPFSILPPKAPYELASIFFTPASYSLVLFPSLELDLARASYDIRPVIYAAASLANAVVNFIIAILVVDGMGSLLHKEVTLIGLGLGIVLFVATYFTCLIYPQVVGLRYQSEIDSELVPATRKILIQVRSGVPLYNAILSASSDHGAASKEFERVVLKLNAGMPEADALSDASSSSPSQKFRKVAWQISNALKVGSDIGVALSSILEELEADRTEQIKRYAQELSPLTMVYMVAAIILPSLGVTMLIVIGSMLSLPIPKQILIVVFVVMVLFQMVFLNFAAGRRPRV